MTGKQKFIKTMQRYVAVTAIGPSALRNQGASGVIDAARDFLAKLDLSDFKVNNRAEFDALLNSITDYLSAKFPKNKKGQKN